jgi:hypothetical protein
VNPATASLRDQLRAIEGGLSRRRGVREDAGVAADDFEFSRGEAVSGGGLQAARPTGAIPDPAANVTGGRPLPPPSPGGRGENPRAM